MDLPLSLVAEDHGITLARAVARQLVLFLHRPGGQSQFSTQLEEQLSDHPRIADLQAWMADHLEEDLSVEALARRAAMSPRSFARVFTRAMGVTPARRVEQLRVEAARRRLGETDAGMDDIAARCGFGTAESMRRAFLRTLRERYGLQLQGKCVMSDKMPGVQKFHAVVDGRIYLGGSEGCISQLKENPATFVDVKTGKRVARTDSPTQDERPKVAILIFEGVQKARSVRLLKQEGDTRWWKKSWEVEGGEAPQVLKWVGESLAERWKSAGASGSESHWTMADDEGNRWRATVQAAKQKGSDKLEVSILVNRTPAASHARN